MNEACPPISDSKSCSILTVHLQPEERSLILPRAQAKNVRQLLQTLHLRPCSALVVREDTLLTPDLPLYPGQVLTVRKVMSSG